MFFLLISIFFSCSSSVMAQFKVTTHPETTTDSYTHVSAPLYGNITMYCMTYNGDFQINSIWYIKRPSIESTLTIITLSNRIITSPADLSDYITISGDPISDTATLATNFTINNFTSQFDGALVQCGVIGKKSGILKLGISGFPILQSNLTTPQYVIEGDDITVTVNGVNDPFPPKVSYEWYHNGIAIVNNSNNITFFQNSNNQYTITFSNTSRTMVGLYELVVENTVGHSNASFILDVQFEPAVIALIINQSITIRPGGTATLQTFSPIIEGNPSPMVTWSGPDGLPRTNGDRFNLSVPVTIIIVNVTLELDNGTYVCTVSNGIGRNYSQSINLLIGVPASAPSEILWTNTTNTSTQVHLTPPSFPGIPRYSFYHITLAPPLPSNTIKTISFSTNSTLLTGLTPYTSYSVTIMCVSLDDNMDWINGDTNTTTILTLPGVPQIVNLSVYTSHGYINVLGTIKLNNEAGYATVLCYRSDKGTENGSLSDYTWRKEFGSSDTHDDQVSYRIGPVEAMVEYSCIIEVVNEIGIDTRMITNIVSSNGLPSPPSIVRSHISPNKVSLSVTMAHAGDDTIWLLVEVYTAGNLTHSLYQYPSCNTTYGGLAGISCDSIDILIEEGNSYVVIIRATNNYGYTRNNITIEIEGSPNPQVQITGNTTANITHHVINDCSVLLTGVLVPIMAISILVLILLIIVMVLCTRYYSRKVHNEAHSTSPDDPAVQGRIYETIDIKDSCGNTAGKPQSSVMADDCCKDVSVQNNIAYSEVPKRT